MKKMEKKVLSLLLVALMMMSNFGVMPVRAQRGDTATIIDVTDFGADPSGKEDSVVAVQEAIAAAKKTNGDVVLNFPAGEYHFWPDDATVRRIYISNSTTPSSTDYEENSIRTIGMLFEDMQDVTVEGNDSLFMFHGRMMSFVTIDCDNVVFQNFTYDFARPHVIDLTVEEVDDTSATVYIPDCYEYEISGKIINFYGEISPKTGQRYWQYTSYPYDQINEMTTGNTYRVWDGGQTLLNGVTSIEELGERRVKFNYSTTPRAKAGYNIQIKEVTRDNPSVLIWTSKDVVMRNINGRFLHSFGIVGQLSENITIDNVQFMTDPSKGTLTSASADMMQMSGCKGKLTITNCEFVNPQDDPINIHGTFLRISEVLAPNKIQVTFVERETYGFDNFLVGDEVEFIQRSNMMSVDETHIAKVTEVEGPDEDDCNVTARKNYILTLDRDIPGVITASNCSSYVVENITYTPEVYIQNCTFRESSVRGVLCTTRKKVVIEDCLFENINMSAIYISDDANGWYESGYFRDVTIRNNTFVDCGSNGAAIIYIQPVVSSETAGNYVHKNLVIEGNTFYAQESQYVLHARFTDGITFRGNTIYSANEASALLSANKEIMDVGDIASFDFAFYPEENINTKLFYLYACTNAVFEGNIYHDGLNKSIVLANMDESGVTIAPDEDLVIGVNNYSGGVAGVSSVEYRISDPSVIQLDEENGLIYALGYGTATVSAYVISTDGKEHLSNELTITVTGTGKELFIQSSSDTLSAVGETMFLEAVGDGGEAEDVQWSVSSLTPASVSGVASVSSDGVLTAIGNGVVFVKAETADGRTAGKIVTVTIPKDTVNAMILENESDYWHVGDDDNLLVTVMSNRGIYESNNVMKNFFLFDLGDDVENCEATIKMNGATSSAYEETGFGFFTDADNYVAVQRKNHLGTVLVNEYNAIGSEAVRVGYYNSNEVYFKIVKADNHYTGYYSLNNEDWSLIGNVTNDTIGNGADVKLAVWVANGSNNVYQFSNLTVNGEAYPIVRANQNPSASEVSVSGTGEIGNTLQAGYVFDDPDGDGEGESIVAWYISDEEDGVYQPIENVYGTSIVLDSEYANRYIKAAVIPVDEHGAVGRESGLSHAIYVSGSRNTANPYGNRITEIGDTLQFEVESEKNVLWRVIDPSTGAATQAASIDSNGLLTALRPGVVRVQAITTAGVLLDQLVTIFTGEPLFNGTIYEEAEEYWWFDENDRVHLVNDINIRGFFDSREEVSNLMLIDLGDDVENCTAIIKQTGTTRASYEETGFGFLKDLDNFVAVQRKQHLGTILVTESNGTGNEAVRVGYYNSNEVYFKIEKAGDSYTGHYSIDNQATWELIGTLTNTTVGNSLQLGFWTVYGNNNEFVFEDLSINGESVPLRRDNTAPEVSGLQIEGTPKAGQNLTVSYDFYDADGDAETDSLVSWYISDTEEGAYTKIMNVSVDTLPLKADYIGKYIKASVIALDDGQGIGEETFTDVPVLVGERDGSDVHLADLSVKTANGSSVTLTPSFHSDVFAYEAVTTSAVISIDARAEKEADIAVTVNGQSASADAITLQEGENSIVLQVSNSEGGTVYRLNILYNRFVSKNAYLSTASVDGLDLQPAFSPKHNKYIASVTKEITSIPVSFAASGSEAGIAVTINGQPVCDKVNTFTGDIPLSTGFNYIMVTVTAPDGETENTYRIIVIRNGFADANANSISINGQPLKGFSSDILEYSIAINKSQADNTAIAAELSSNRASASITVNGRRTEGTDATASLQLGSNTVIAAVRADDAVTNQYYTINIEVVALYTNFLEYSIGYAEKVVTSGELETVIPIVKENFEKALEEAKIVLEDAQSVNITVTQEDVDNAAEALLKMIHYLDFKKVDKSDLIKLIETAEKYEARRAEFIAGTFEPFAAALEKARKVVADENLMEADEVTEAWDELTDAILGLRLIPDKSKLEKLIGIASSKDISLYTAESIMPMQAVLVKAIDVHGNENAEQPEVDQITLELQKAVDGLVPIRTGNNDHTDSVNNGSSGNPAADSGSGSSKDGMSQSISPNAAKGNPKTGDTAAAGMALILFILSVQLLFVIKKAISKK